MTRRNIHSFLTDETGFSLIEMLVGIFLLSIVSVLTTMIISGYFKGNETVDRTLSRLEQMADARRLISDDLLHFENYVLSRTNSKTSNKNEQLLLQFTRSASPVADIDPKVSSLKQIEYWRRDDTLYRRSYSRPNPTFKTTYWDYKLLSNVKNVELEYLVGNRWLKHLNNTGVATSESPKTPEVIKFQWRFLADEKSGIRKDYSSLFRLGGQL